MREDTAVVLHVYKPFKALDPNEREAVLQARKVFNDRIYVVCPLGMDCEGYGPRRISLPQRYFTYGGYNTLMKTEQFYQMFMDMGYTYQVIIQPDVWVFQDGFDYFLEKFDQEGYDYIGAPWYSVWFAPDGAVGNGGFCIRRLETFRNICRKDPRGSGNEDVFFLRTHRKDIKVAPEKLALEFSFEEKPFYAFKLAEYKVPLGCHAYASTSDRISFWDHYIPGIQEVKCKKGNPNIYNNPTHVVGEND